MGRDGHNIMTSLWQRIMDTNPLAYWPMNEQWGNNALDATGNSFTGTYANVNLNQSGIGDGTPSVEFTTGSSSTSSILNVFSSSFQSAFNGSEGTFLVWAKSKKVTHPLDQYICSFTVNNNNRVRIYSQGNTTNVFFEYVASGSSKQNIYTPLNTSWFIPAITWSKSNNQIITYWNGVQFGSVLTGLRNWVGTLSSTRTGIGCSATTGSIIPFNGYLAHAAIWTRPLSPTEMLNLSQVTITDPVRNYNTRVHYIDYDKRGLGFLYGAMKAKGKV